MTPHAKTIGALNDDERAVIAERDRLREQYFAAENEEERARLMSQINETVARYDALRRARRKRGEID